MRGAFLSQRVDRRIDEQVERGGGDAESLSSSGRSRGRPAEGRAGYGERQSDENWPMPPLVAEETLFYYAVKSEHWCCLRTNNPPERIHARCDEEPVPWARFPDRKWAFMLAAARLRHVAGMRWERPAIWT